MFDVSQQRKCIRAKRKAATAFAPPRADLVLARAILLLLLLGAAAAVLRSSSARAPPLLLLPLRPVDRHRIAITAAITAAAAAAWPPPLLEDRERLFERRALALYEVVPDLQLHDVRVL